LSTFIIIMNRRWCLQVKYNWKYAAGFENGTERYATFSLSCYLHPPPPQYVACARRKHILNKCMLHALCCLFIIMICACVSGFLGRVILWHIFENASLWIHKFRLDVGLISFVITCMICSSVKPLCTELVVYQNLSHQLYLIDYSPTIYHGRSLIPPPPNISIVLVQRALKTTMNIWEGVSDFARDKLATLIICI